MLDFSRTHGGQHISGTRSHTNLYNDNQSNEDSGNSSSEQSPPNSPPRSSLLCSVENSPLRSSYEPVSFESMIKQTSTPHESSQKLWQLQQDHRESCCDIDKVSEGDFKRLQPLLWLELASLFDKNHVALDKRKPFKRKRKEEGNVFGVSLNALVRRDQQITGEDTTLVPLILQAILSELRLRGAKEEGILRVPGHKQKVRISCCKSSAKRTNPPFSF